MNIDEIVTELFIPIIGMIRAYKSIKSKVRVTKRVMQTLK